jgi:hypothetical protein
VPTDITITKATARVQDEALRLDGFEERDPEVVNFVSASPDAESAVHRVMQVGARALGLAQTSVDTSLVQTAFDGFSRELDGRLGSTMEQLGEIGEDLLNAESGSLTKALSGFRGQLDELLGNTFDPDSKKGVLAAFDRIFTEAGQRQLDALRRIIDPDDAQSPLGRHRAEIIQRVKESEEKLTRAVNEISERLAVKTVQSELLEKTSSKGFSYEELVHSTISGVAGAHADVAERVGNQLGAMGSKAGDEVVTLCLDDTRGASARYVLEFKDRSLGKNATFEELERAMANREAGVGIAVFSREEHSPVVGPFQFWGNYAIVVLDKDLVDDGALRLACLWARMTLRRQLTDQTAEVDFDRISALVEEGRRSLDRLATVRRYHSSARKSIEQASGQVGDMASELDRVLDAIAKAISA